MEKTGKVCEIFTVYQKGMPEAWYSKVVESDEDGRGPRAILVMRDNSLLEVWDSSDQGAWTNTIYWREIPLPDTRSDVERERDEFRVELDELRVVIGKIANEVGNPDSDARIRGILLASMDLRRRK